MDKFDIDTLKNHNAKLFRERQEMRQQIDSLQARLSQYEVEPSKIKGLEAQLRHVERQLEAEKAKPPKVIKQQVVTRESDTVRLLKSKVKELEKQIDMMAQRLNQRADHGSGD